MTFGTPCNSTDIGGLTFGHFSICHCPMSREITFGLLVGTKLFAGRVFDAFRSQHKHRQREYDDE
jgi:hypothetical protein